MAQSISDPSQARRGPAAARPGAQALASRRASVSAPAGDGGIAQALADYIRARNAADAVSVVAFERLSGGAIQSNYALTVHSEGGRRSGELALVVRSDAPSKVSASLTRAQEFSVLRRAFEAGVTVPEPLWLCEDESIIGSAFCVMARVPGVASGRQLVRGGVTPEQAVPLTRQLGEELARLHGVRPPDPDLAFLVLPGMSRALERVHEYRRALDSISEAHPVLEYALNWLEDREPGQGEIVLSHGDFRTGNYMVHDGRVSGILDWEFASWSDPLEDLGWLCSRSWRFGKPDKEVGGIGDKVDLLDAYAQVSGRQVDAEKVLYWEVMGMTRWAVIALQQAQRHVSGEESSLELALTGRMLPEIEFDLLNQIDLLERQT
ncbi:phosphotransferase family protein [Allopusillimonas ginsengisoli]|uniref:phosphotransferase family protein n=1 Tax=Allopusillimonas ginsengisoli TaxID=453575 RepID=UPI001021C6DE|nr:phosphotransferase family protein [Allopusillimonas ginsengisoli]TEA78611.1 phosphotransferase family protein [Allopusillimonas ginsengisoli]